MTKRNKIFNKFNGKCAYCGSNIADGGDFKALLLHHSTKLNSSTQLWHVCPTIGNILLAAVKFLSNG